MKPTKQDPKLTSTRWCLPLALLLGLGLFAADDATAQRRKRAKDRKAEPETKVEESSQGAGEEASLVGSLGMFVYPADEQSPELQNSDEAECSVWAQEQIGDMPASSTATEPTADADSGRRADRKQGGGALKGAAVGAVVGEALEGDEPDLSRKELEKVGDDVKDADSREEARHELERAARQNDRSGAETGAAVGAVTGRRRQSKQQKKAAEAADSASQAAESAESDSLRSAMKVCLESRGYRVES